MSLVSELIEQRLKLIALQAALPTTSYGIIRGTALASHITKTNELIELALKAEKSTSGDA